MKLSTFVAAASLSSLLIFGGGIGLANSENENQKKLSLSVVALGAAGAVTTMVRDGHITKLFKFGKEESNKGKEGDK